METQQFLALILRGWWVVVLAMVVSASSTLFFVSRQAPMYRASTTVELIPLAALDAREVVDVYNLLDKRNISNTLARKAEGSSMEQLVVEKLGVAPSAVRDAEIAAIVLPDSNIIEIRASSTSPELAAAICNTVAAEMLGQTPDKILQIEAIDQAFPPGTPIAPQPGRILALALFSGLVLGVVFLVLEHMVRGASGAGGPGGIGGQREPGLATPTGD